MKQYKEIRTLTAYTIEIAADIAEHSVLRDGYDIEGIAWEVNRACNVAFEVL